MRLRGMLLILVGLMLAGTALAQPLAHYRTSPDGVLLPDPRATPGATLSVTVPHLCTPGYTQTVRNVPAAVKRHVYALYGVKPKPGVCCEVDHLISLELGGSNDLTNLWPQPYAPTPGAHEKDVLENFMHRAVCTGAMTLQEAQQKIAKDWYAAYKEMQGTRP